MVLDVHGRKPEGVLRTAKRLQKEGHDISYTAETKFVYENQAFA